MDENIGPRIYAACLASYNAGKLHGEWIDASQTADEIKAEIQTMLDQSPEPFADEWAIHDHEGWHGLRVEEHEDIDLLASVAELLEEHGPVFAALTSYLGGIKYLHETIRMMDGYLGQWKSVEDWAWSFLEDSGDLKSIPQSLLRYLDVKEFGEDLVRGGEILVFELDVGGGVHIFWSH